MPDETPQPIPPESTGMPDSTESPAPHESVSVPENISESQPTEPSLSEEIKSESNSAEASLDKPTPIISEPIVETPAPTKPNITIEKTPDTITITEVMEPKAPIPEPTKPDQKTFLASLLPKLKEKLSFRTEKRLSKIMELVRKQGEIQNDEVEKLLHISDASASRYLAKLVQRGSLRVSGPKNHSKYLPN